MEVIHIRRDDFDVENIRKIKNRRHFNKPSGGLWTCPVDSRDDEYISGWHRFSCEVMNRDEEVQIVKLKLRDDARIINSMQIKEMFKLDRDFLSIEESEKLDFEFLATNYDVIEYLEGYSYGVFYGWDVDTCLILNKEAIESYEILK